MCINTCKLFILLCFCLNDVWSEFEPGGKPQAYIINPEAESVIGMLHC